MTAIELSVDEVRAEGKYSWAPFARDPEFARFDAWHRGMPACVDRCWQVFEGSVPVARLAMFYRDRGLAGSYRDATGLDDALEIYMIEVPARHRRRGIATAVVDLVARSEPGRQVVAQSEDANSDLFWASLGWAAHRHLDEERPEFRHYRVLYVQAAH